MDDITTRLKETSDSLLNAYQKWGANKKDQDAREVLMDAIHEVRKVASRLEIDVAVAERGDLSERPIPVPPHRAAQPRDRESSSGGYGDDRPPRYSQNGGGGGNGDRDVMPMRRRQPYNNGGHQGRRDHNNGPRGGNGTSDEG